MDGSTTDMSRDVFHNTLATWNQARTTDELRRFVEIRHAALPADIDIE